MKTRRLDLSQYGNVAVHWCIGANAYSEWKRMSNTFPCYDPDIAEDSTNGTCCWSNGNFGLFIWNPSPETLAHEIFHCVYHICKHLRITLSDDSEECFAYLTQYLFAAMYKELLVALEPLD